VLKLSDEKLKIKHCFNRAALSYDESDQLQFAMGEVLLQQLSEYELVASANLLDVGCGTGKLTYELAKMFLDAKIFAVDIADKFISLAQNRLVTMPAQVLHADFDDMPFADKSIDLVFSNMALHWSVDFDKSLMEITRVLNNRGMFAFSLPIQGTFAELIASQKPFNKVMPHQFLAVESVTKYLQKQGYDVLMLKSKQYTCYFADLMQLVRSIKNTGANYVKPQHGTMTTKKYFVQLEKNYQKFKTADTERLPLTYAIAFFIAQKR